MDRDANPCGYFRMLRQGWFNVFSVPKFTLLAFPTLMKNKKMTIFFNTWAANSMYLFYKGCIILEYPSILPDLCYKISLFLWQRERKVNLVPAASETSRLTGDGYFNVAGGAPGRVTRFYKNCKSHLTMAAMFSLIDQNKQMAQETGAEMRE